MKLLVRNLNRSTTQAELLELFSEYGLVSTCTLVMDKSSGQSKGFGFVEMPKTQEAKTAMKRLNGKDLAGNRVRVKTVEEEEKTDKKS